MTLVRWEQDPFREVSRLLSTFFDVSPENGGGGRRWIPAVDVTEHEDRFALRADLPGVSEDDVNVEVDGRVLTISGERRSERREDERGYRRVERAYGAFSRSLTLPEGVDADAIAASYDRGVLEVSIPKPAERRPHRVAIAVGASQPEAVEGKQSAEGAQPAAEA